MSTALVAAGATAIGTATTAQNADTTNPTTNNTTTGQKFLNNRMTQTEQIFETNSQSELDANAKDAQTAVNDAKYSIADKTGQAQTAADAAKGPWCSRSQKKIAKRRLRI